jgi:hypothetical protein
VLSVDMEIIFVSRVHVDVEKLEVCENIERGNWWFEFFAWKSQRFLRTGLGF